MDSLKHRALQIGGTGSLGTDALALLSTVGTEVISGAFRKSPQALTVPAEVQLRKCQQRWFRF